MKNLSSLATIWPGPTLLLDQEYLPDEGLMSSKSQSCRRSSAHSLPGCRKMLPPLFSDEWRVRFRSPTMITFSILIRSAWCFIVSQHSFFSLMLTGEYTLKIVIVSFVSRFCIFCINQWVLLASYLSAYMLGFHRISIPPEAPLAEVALASLLGHKFFLICRKSLSSSLVSWMRSMSGASVLARFLMASFLTFLPRPLQFQEMTFIIYVSGGLPWSLGVDFSSFLALRRGAFLALVGCPVACLCRSATLFSLYLFCALLLIFLPRFGNLLFRPLL